MKEGSSSDNVLTLGGFVSGATGMEVAKRAKCFGMDVTAVTKPPENKINRLQFDNSSHNSEFMYKILGIKTLYDSLATADYVSIHTSLTNETRGLLGPKQINLMKESAFLVNVSRAQIVDRDALFEGFG